jgi:hypothetical protein
LSDASSATNQSTVALAPTEVGPSVVPGLVIRGRRQCPGPRELRFRRKRHLSGASVPSDMRRFRLALETDVKGTDWLDQGLYPLGRFPPLVSEIASAQVVPRQRGPGSTLTRTPFRVPTNTARSKAITLEVP